MKKIIISALTSVALLSPLYAQNKIKLGLMLPYSGTFAQLGNDIEAGFRLFVKEQGGKLAGKEIEYVKLDDESDPAKGADNANKIINRDKVDVLIGTVHSGVALAMAKIARESETLLIIPNAGANEITGQFCDKHVFRSSFSNWQAAYGAGVLAANAGVKKIVTLTWKYAAGDQTVQGFKDGFATKAGGEILADLSLPFPNVEYQPLLAKIAELKPDAVYVFFSGAASTKFLKDYSDAGLKAKFPIYATFLTDGVLDTTGNTAEGVISAMHYGDGLDEPRDKAFRAAFKKEYNKDPDVYSVQGYDTAQLLLAGLRGQKNGDIKDKAGFIKAAESAIIDSPRGKFYLNKAHNPVQHIYARKTIGKENKITGFAVKNLDDPAKGCAMVQ